VKKVLSLLILLTLILTLVSCGEKTQGADQENNKAEWTINVEGASAAKFTSNDYGEIKEVDINATLKKKDGTEQKQVFTGISFASVLELLGVKEYTKVVVEAGDGYSKEYTPDLVKDSGTVLATKADGKELGDSGPVELVVGSQGGSMWIKNVAKIKVVK
jgi:DMSO/TMAO reductase YedYZ molybdopterin-dependent catalytic subunit